MTFRGAGERGGSYYVLIDREELGERSIHRSLKRARDVWPCTLLVVFGELRIKSRYERGKSGLNTTMNIAMDSFFKGRIHQMGPPATLFPTI